MTTQDTATTAHEATAEPSPVCTDALWRLPVTVCRITNFLGEQTSAAVLRRAMAAADGLMPPSTIGPDRQVNRDIWRSRSGHDFAVPELLSCIDEVQEAVEHTLGVSCQGTEPTYGLISYNDGDFYAPHQDSTPEFHPERMLKFVYFVHRTPRPFTGGELRVFDIALPLHTEGSVSWEDRTWRDWEPEHDSIVFFRPSAWHEVRKVSCPTKQPEDSRFAINGWLGAPHMTSN
ncbi:2OG-Fe(II) oxygenase [Streptomyces kronopolitis]|uniref:2OG-Fe(II) oxygenase n=1 Tax=Streptomyces kronopolitis TaxID=1612435 RepID=UPI0016679901|nr:2OG-Fe(II) oxygenase [Streptomyces kronopolitis]